jgi:hypothetical protein
MGGMKTASGPLTTDATIWERIVDPRAGGLRPQVARVLLTLNFSPADRSRMDELAEKAQAGTLSAAERVEAESHNRVAHLLALLHSRARQSLKMASARKRP